MPLVSAVDEVFLSQLFSFTRFDIAVGFLRSKSYKWALWDTLG